MTYPVFSPPINPQKADDNVTGQKNDNSFGDGYEQTIILGLNAVKSELPLSWPVLTETQKNSIAGFLKTNAGKTFLWGLPGESQRKWKCDKWEIKRDRAQVSIDATFREVFA